MEITFELYVEDRIYGKKIVKMRVTDEEIVEKILKPAIEDFEEEGRFKVVNFSVESIST